MKRPPLRTMVIGHPVVALAAQLAGVVLLYRFWLAGTDAAIPALVVFFAMGGALRSNEARTAYKRWAAEWEAADGTAIRRPIRLGSYVVLVVGGLVGLTLVSRSTTSGSMLAAGWIGGAIAAVICAELLGIVAKLFRFRWVRPYKVVPVTVVAKQSMRPVPLAESFALLPEHCQRILRTPVL